MSALIFHIPDDDEIAMGAHNSRRRAVFLRACALCKHDFDVRDGKWLQMFSRKGTEIAIKICDQCYAEEMK